MYTRFVRLFKEHELSFSNVQSVTFKGRTITGQLRDNKSFITYSAETDNSALIKELRENNVEFKAEQPDQGLLTQIFISWFPIFLIVGIMIFLMR